MALIVCPECGAGISERAVVCPRCGCLMKEDTAVPQPAVAQAPAGRRVRGFEWKSKAQILGWPLIHVAIGRNKETGRLMVARGIMATGTTAVGRFAFGKYVLAQLGAGKHVWTTKTRDVEAVKHFQGLWDSMKALLGW